MAARESMAPLITRLRRLIGDPASSEQTWSDEELEDALDQHRLDRAYVSLTPVDSIAAGTGAVSWLEWWAEAGDWEADATLVDGTYAPLTPDTSMPLLGRWVFAAHQAGPVLLSGRQYDLYGAAADVLEAWADLSRRTVTDWKDTVKALLDSAARYRARQAPQTVRMVRSDLNRNA